MKENNKVDVVNGSFSGAKIKLRRNLAEVHSKCL